MGKEPDLSNQRNCDPILTAGNGWLPVPFANAVEALAQPVEFSVLDGMGRCLVIRIGVVNQSSSHIIALSRM